MSAFLSALSRVAEAQGNAALSNQDLQRQLSDPLRLEQIKEANLRLQELQKQIGRENLPKFGGVIPLPSGGSGAIMVDPSTGQPSVKPLVSVDSADYDALAKQAISDMPDDVQKEASDVYTNTKAAKGPVEALRALNPFLARQPRTITTKSLMGPDGVQHSYVLDENGNKIKDLGPVGTSKPASLVDRYNQAVASGDKKAATSLAAQIRSEYDLTHPYAQEQATQRTEQAALMRMQKADAAAKPYTQIVSAADKGLQAAAEQTGPGDVAFLMSFVDATRPSVFRFSPTEIDLIKNARAMGGANLTAAILRAKGGLLFTPSQRTQMINALMKAKQQANRMATETYKRYGVAAPSFVDSGTGASAPPPGTVPIP